MGDMWMMIVYWVAGRLVLGDIEYCGAGGILRMYSGCCIVLVERYTLRVEVRLFMCARPC